MLQLTAKEIGIIQMALETMLDDVINPMSKDPKIPFNPLARAAMKDMKESAESALAKVKTVSGIDSNMVEYKPGDEDEFLTKES